MGVSLMKLLDAKIRGFTVRKILKTSAPVLVLALGVGVVQALVATKPAPEKKDDALRLVSLYVDEVFTETSNISVQTQGEARPKTEIDLIPQVSGRITFVAEEFAEGAEFSPNTTLIKIEDSEYKLAVVQAEARIAETETNLQRELATAQNKQEQWASKIAEGVIPTPFALNEPQVAEARAKILSAEAELTEAKLNLSRTQIKVPFLGRVMEKTIGVGQYVNVGTKLGRVFSTDRMEIRLPLTDTQLVELNLPMGYMAAAGQGHPVKFSAVVGGKENHWQGHIVRTQAAIDQQTRLVYAIAEVVDPYHSSESAMPLAVGLFVNAEITSSRQQDAFVIPRLALRNADKVYVINDEEKLEIRTVDVLSTSEDRVLLTNGVANGERVVTSTIPAAVDGMQVKALTRDEQEG
ncbi:MAG: RND family efflux transporter MFP subunit [Bacteroidia bacterium]